MRVCHKFIIHPLLVVGRVRICCWKSWNMLLEELGYVVETASIFGRTTAVMRQLLFRLMTHPHTIYRADGNNSEKN